ncbi:mycothiol-dependent nitroreductase Rv2466c family protein [Nocardiopsis potens]|uniref:mycothiol-dependent nitroreductase Rv2466c family protein n=1 Tax=Nocardiopsis potens TaxID=1246458 RepID=UPI000348DF40|nr:hypothetical protein [Nocardiopsis potens]
MAETWTADIWFDPSCPLSRVTARWLEEAARVRPVAVRRHVMSLTILNEHRGDDPEDDPEGYLLIPARICAAVRSRYGSDALGRFHEALWAGHERGEQDWIGAFEEALTAAGLPADLAEAGQGDDYDAELRASHEAGVALVPGDVGTPIIAATGPDGRRIAFFGPVVAEAPTGEQAGRLWDGLLLVAGTPGFRELKGPAD